MTIQSTSSMTRLKWSSLLVCILKCVSFPLGLGNRYLFSEQWMPNFKDWAVNYAHIDLSKKTEKQKDMEVHAPYFNHEFLAELGEKGFQRRSFLKWERIMHSHGATL
jgi:hypothetical protein